MWPYIHGICVIAPTLSMISQPPYILYHIRYTCDILHTIYMISYPLCMTTQHCVWLIPHSAYALHHLHYRCYHIHSITPHHSIYDVTSTSGVTSQTLYQISHPLYLFITTSPLIWYPPLYDIIPTIWVTSYALYITSYPLLKSSHYCTYAITASIYETTSSM